MHSFANFTLKPGQMWHSPSYSTHKYMNYYRRAHLLPYVLLSLRPGYPFPDKLIKLPSHKTLSCILLADHTFTTNISFSPSPLTCPTSLDAILVLMTDVPSMNDTPILAVPPNLKISITTPVNYSTTRTLTPNTSNGRLHVITTSASHLPISCNAVISHLNLSPPSEFRSFLWIRLSTRSLPFSRYCTRHIPPPMSRLTAAYLLSRTVPNNRSLKHVNILAVPTILTTQNKPFSTRCLYTLVPPPYAFVPPTTLPINIPFPCVNYVLSSSEKVLQSV